MLGLFSKSRISSLCAFCKSERKINRKKNLGLADYLTAGVCALIAMAVVFKDFDPRMFIFYIAFIAIGEFFVQLRWRMGVVCPHCGFDPVLYLKAPEKAADVVTQKLEQRRKDPKMLLARKLDIPQRRVAPKKPVQNDSARL
jgi:hypothetical protein